MFQHSPEQKEEKWSQVKNKLLKFEQANDFTKKQLFLLHKVRQLSIQLNNLIQLPFFTIPETKDEVFLLIEKIHRILMGQTTDEQKLEQKEFHHIRTQQVQTVFSVDELFEEKKIKKAMIVLYFSCELLTLKTKIFRAGIEGPINLIYHLRHSLYGWHGQYESIIPNCFLRLRKEVIQSDLDKSQEYWKQNQRQINLLKATVQQLQKGNSSIYKQEIDQLQQIL